MTEREEADVPQEKPFGRGRGFVYASPPRPPEDDWIAVVGESFVALLEPGAGERGIGSLSSLAGAELTPLEEVVSAIPAGDGGVDSFALVHFDADGGDGWQVTAVARGRAVVDVYSLGGARRFSSSGVQPWLMATFRDVSSVELSGPARRFDVASHRTSSALPVGLGTVRTGSLLWSEDASPDWIGDPPGRGRPGSDDADVVFERPSADLDDDTVRHVRVGALASGLHPVAFDDQTIVRVPPERGTERASRAAGGHPPAVRNEPDEQTVLRAPTQTVQGDWMGGDGAQEEPPDRVMVGIRGLQRTVLDVPIVFGRRPAEGRRSATTTVLVTVDSPNDEVSASHVRIERVGRAVVVTDLKSRNGTTVTIDGGRPHRLRPGESFSVPGTAAVEIGDGTIIDITPVGWKS